MSCRREETKRSSCNFSGIEMRTVGIFSVLPPLESRRRAGRDHARRWQADRDGHAQPPREEECPPRPEDGLCQCCGEPVKAFHLDHCHDIGAFRGWVCHGCNTGTGIKDNVERLKKRVAFLEAHEKKMERVALIKAVHAGNKE